MGGLEKVPFLFTSSPHPPAQTGPPVQGKWKWPLGEAGAELWGQSWDPAQKGKNKVALLEGLPSTLGIQALQGPMLWRSRRAGTSGPWLPYLFPRALSGKGSSFLLRVWKLRLKGVRQLARVSPAAFLHQFSLGSGVAGRAVYGLRSMVPWDVLGSLPHPEPTPWWSGNEPTRNPWH